MVFSATRTTLNHFRNYMLHGLFDNRNELKSLNTNKNLITITLSLFSSGLYVSTTGPQAFLRSLNAFSDWHLRQK